MPAGGEHVVVGDDDRWRLQVAPAAVAQAADIGVFHLREVDADHCEVVLADGAQQLVHAPRLQHTVVLLLIVDGGAARVGEVACQLAVTVGRQALQHTAYFAKLPGYITFLLLVGVAVDFLLVLFRVSEVVLLLVVAHLLVDLFLPEGVEMYVGDGVRNLLDLCVRKALEYV